MTTPTTPTSLFSKSENFQSTMSSLNYGHVMERAARDYQREILEKEDTEDDLSRRRRRNNATINLNEEEEDDDSVQQMMKEKRLEALKNGTTTNKRQYEVLMMGFLFVLSL